MERGEIRAQPITLDEVERFRQSIQRDIEDASIPSLSLDRRFAIWYNAALQLASLMVRCRGYRISAVEGHHALTLETLILTLGPSAAEDVVYFNACRAKRHLINYGSAFVISEAESTELQEEVLRFQATVEGWIAREYPELGRSQPPSPEPPR